MDMEDFNQAWRQHSDSLRRYLAHSILSQEDAKDALNDIALKCLENWHKIRKKDDPKPWMYQIARNHVRDYYRSHHHRYSRSLENADVVDLIREYDRIDIDLLAAKEFLSRLDGLWPAVLALSLYHGYTYNEIAAITGQSRSIIARRLPLLIKMLASTLYLEDENESNG